MLPEYEKLRIDLGSIQYYNIANNYTELVDESADLDQWLNDQKKIETFKANTLIFINELIVGYNRVKESEYFTDLTDEECSVVGVYDKEGFYELKEALREDEVFGLQLNRPPKSDKSVKLFLMRWFNQLREKAWDLWSALAYFSNGTGLGADIEEDPDLAGIIYIVKEVYNFTDDEIERTMGDFAT